MTVAIIQARMGSTRLPGKALLKVMGKTMLQYVVERTRKAKKIDNIIVATTVKKEDQKIVNLVNSLGIDVYCGSDEDVLERFYQAAKLFKVKDIVRITADCPLIDPKIIDDTIDYYFERGADYCSNAIEETFPDGLDVSVFSFSALSNAWENAMLLSEREHVTPYIRKNPDKFKIVNFRNELNLSDKRWTLDTEKDFRFISAIMESLYSVKPDFRMKDVLEFLRRNPHIEDINKGIVRNEGYLKSLKEDRRV